MHRVSLRIIVVMAALVASVVVGAGASPASEGGNYCAMEVDDPATMTCASSSDALDHAWQLENKARRVQLLIARFYDNANYDTSAGYLEIYAAADCTASKTGVDSQNSDLGTWRDRISSLKSFGNCATRLWTGTSFTGTAYPSSGSYIVNSSSIGSSMNDKARSAQFS